MKFRFPTCSQIIFCVLGFFALVVMAVPLSIMTDNFTVFCGLFFLEYWTDEKGAQRSEVARNVGLMSAAVIGLVLAFWRSLIADKQRALTERGLITERINKAVENLGHETVAVKLGGVYALWRLIEEIPGQDKDARRSDVKMILDILTAFVRHDAKERVSDGKSGKPVLRADVETAVKLLGDKNAPYRSITPDYKLNLHGANLSGATLYDCDFQNTVFVAADLSEAYLGLTKFSGAIMHTAILTNANLSGVDFTGAIGMTQKQVDSAFWDDFGPPILPVDLNAPPQKPKKEE
ncbi:MAG: pentapeptide repeat-containing protein [Rhodospirillales bacterium]